MLGSFLEISIHSPDVMESVGFFRDLGFRELDTGEVWTHPYAVVTDGVLVIGLHAYEFESPSLTYVRPELAGYARGLKHVGVRFEFQKLADDEFNELGFLDPGGLMVTLLEARTHSPIERQTNPSPCGGLLEFSIPADDLAESMSFWERLGFVVIAKADEPHPFCRLSREGIQLGLHERRFRAGPTFLGTDLVTRGEFLKAKGFHPKPGGIGNLTGLELQSPEGTPLYLLEQDWT